MVEIPELDELEEVWKIADAPLELPDQREYKSDNDSGFLLKAMVLVVLWAMLLPLIVIFGHILVNSF